MENHSGFTGRQFSFCAASLIVIVNHRTLFIMSKLYCRQKKKANLETRSCWLFWLWTTHHFVEKVFSFYTHFLCSKGYPHLIRQLLLLILHMHCYYCFLTMFASDIFYVLTILFSLLCCSCRTIHLYFNPCACLTCLIWIGFLLVIAYTYLLFQIGCDQ